MLGVLADPGRNEPPVGLALPACDYDLPLVVMGDPVMAGVSSAPASAPVITCEPVLEQAHDPDSKPDVPVPVQQVRALTKPEIRTPSRAAHLEPPVVSLRHDEVSSMFGGTAALDILDREREVGVYAVHKGPQPNLVSRVGSPPLEHEG